MISMTSKQAICYFLKKRSPNFVNSPLPFYCNYWRKLGNRIGSVLVLFTYCHKRLFLCCLFVQVNAYSEFQVDSEVHMNWTLFGNFGSRSGELLIKMYMVGQLICTSQDYQTAFFCWLINLIQSCGQQPNPILWKFR